MLNVVGVRFKKAGKVYYFDSAGLTMEQGMYVIVETVRGVEFGKVVMVNREVTEDDVALPLKKVIRVAEERDFRTIEENRRKASLAYDLCEEKIRERGLDMGLIEVEYTFDCSKVVFYFAAEGRIDFRELVRDLAMVLHTRIEMRQIGVRDEAKMLGGVGPCGRMLCCATFLGDFEPVSIKMAKDQSLSLNPTKISGICGRLMCCLKYENDEYESILQMMPDIGAKVETPSGAGKVIGLNILERIMQVSLDKENRVVEYTLEEMTEEGLLPKVKIEQ